MSSAVIELLRKITYYVKFIDVHFCRGGKDMIYENCQKEIYLVCCAIDSLDMDSCFSVRIFFINDLYVVAVGRASDSDYVRTLFSCNK